MSIYNVPIDRQTISDRLGLDISDKEWETVKRLLDQEDFQEMYEIVDELVAHVRLENNV